MGADRARRATEEATLSDRELERLVRGTTSLNTRRTHAVLRAYLELARLVRATTSRNTLRKHTVF